MPPRRRAHGAPPAPAAALSCCVLQLPLPVLQAVFWLLPVDARLRCAEVCRAWRSALADRALWTALDFSGCAALTDALLTCAAARAGGQLRALMLCQDDELSHRALCAVITANASTLSELRGVEHDDTGRWLLSSLFVAAPRLRVLEADVTVTTLTLAVAMLSNQGLYGALRLRRMTIRDPNGWPMQWWNLNASALQGLNSALRDHTSLEYLHLDSLDHRVLIPFCDALEAMLMKRLVSFELTLSFSSFTEPEPTLALVVRLLECDTLTHLGLYRLCGIMNQPEDARFAPLLAALKANTTLTALSLSSNQYRNHVNYCKITPLLRALKSHVSLRRLEISDAACESPYWDKLDRGHAAALSELIAADAPALRELHLLNCAVDIKPAISALAHNTHLQSLRYAPMTPGNGVSDNDVRALLVPALRANTALRDLQLEADDSMSRTMRAAVDSVAQRG